MSPPALVGALPSSGAGAPPSPPPDELLDEPPPGQPQRPPTINATATNQMKDATLETGLRTRVPPFISVGEVLRISTETGEYLSRA